MSNPKFAVQPKLTVNTPGDIYEKEADAMADRVMRMSSTETAKPVTGLIGKSLQRKCAHYEEEEKRKPVMRKAEAGISGMSVSSSFASSLNASKGGGSSLPQGTRSFMENAFSTDFSSVKIHTGNEASEMSKGINARAFTTGNNIYFDEGQYKTGSAEGKNLLAHELTHVVQQGIGINRMIMRKGGGKTKLEEFQAKTYSLANHQPSTGKGLFDVVFSPMRGWGILLLNVNMKFDFVNSGAGEFPKAKAADLIWTDAEKETWQANFIYAVMSRWSHNFSFRSTDPDLKGQEAHASVSPIAVDKNFHYYVNVYKIPNGADRQSSVTTSSTKERKNFATFDSSDLEFETTPSSINEKQQAATHEFGHMLGLGDEYDQYGTGGTARHSALVQTALGHTVVKGDSDNIMAGGDTIEKQHYVTILEALQKVTENNKWEFAP